MIKRFFMYGLALLLFSCNVQQEHAPYEDFIKIIAENQKAQDAVKETTEVTE